MIIDVSRWQGLIDWVRVLLFGVHTAIIRCTLGETGVDERYARNWNESRAAGIPKRGIYHYVITGLSAQRQVENILRVTRGDFGNEPITLDCEPTGAELERMAAGWPFPKALYTAMVFDMVQRLSQYHPVRIYTSAYFWSLITTQPAWVTQLPLWAADYRTGRVAPATPPGWAWSRWQYTSSLRVNGIAGNVDGNRDAIILPPPVILTPETRIKRLSSEIASLV